MGRKIWIRGREKSKVKYSGTVVEIANQSKISLRPSVMSTQSSSDVLWKPLPQRNFIPAMPVSWECVAEFHFTFCLS